MGFIYKVSNNFDGKIYIGLTTKSKAIERWYQHRYLARHLSNTDKSYLHRAMALHGVDNFSFEVIEEVSNELLSEREQYWISQYNSIAPIGYNLTSGGEGTPGFSRPQSKEEREKKGQSIKNYYLEHPEARERARQQMIKNNNNPEFRKKALEGYKKFCENHPDYFSGKNNPSYGKHPFSGENNPFYGKHHTEESLQKIHAAAAKRQKAIQQLDKDTKKIIATYAGVKEAEAAIHASHGWLSKAARQNKIAYGYRWKFIESVTTNCNSEISTE